MDAELGCQSRILYVAHVTRPTSSSACLFHSVRSVSHRDILSETTSLLSSMCCQQRWNEYRREGNLLASRTQRGGCGSFWESLDDSAKSLYETKSSTLSVDGKYDAWKVFFTVITSRLTLELVVQNPSTAAAALHWTDERSIYEGDVDQNMLFHGAGVWTYERWQYAGRWERGFPQGLGTITEKDPKTSTKWRRKPFVTHSDTLLGKLSSVYEGEVLGGYEHGFGKKQWFDANGHVIMTHEGKWLDGEFLQGTKTNH